jgi:hypothetical protein
MVFALGRELGLTVDELRKLDPDDQIRHFLDRAQAEQLIYPDFGLEQMKHMLEVYKANYRAYADYVPKRYSGSVILFRAADTEEESRPNYARLQEIESRAGWRFTMCPAGTTTLHLSRELEFSPIGFGSIWREPGLRRNRSLR